MMIMGRIWRLTWIQFLPIPIAPIRTGEYDLTDILLYPVSRDNARIDAITVSERGF
jgi:hypothetical protein